MPKKNNMTSINVPIWVMPFVLMGVTLFALVVYALFSTDVDMLGKYAFAQWATLAVAVVMHIFNDPDEDGVSKMLLSVLGLLLATLLTILGCFILYALAQVGMIFAVIFGLLLIITPVWLFLFVPR